MQTEVVAERLTQTPEIRAFAKHSADVTELHIQLIDDLHARQALRYTPQAPEVTATYQSPQTILP